MSKRWYVVQTKPAAENEAMTQLRQQEFEAFCPKFLQRKIRRGASILIPRPLFPGYAFVAFDRSVDRWHVVNGTRGVQRLMMAGDDYPLPVQRGVVEALIGRISERDGFIHFEDEEWPWAKLKGRTVRTLVGPWVNFYGLVDKADGERVSVLMNLFGRDTPVELHWADLEVVA